MKTFEQIRKNVVGDIEDLPRVERTIPKIKETCEFFIMRGNPDLLPRLGELIEQVEKHCGVIAYSGNMLSSSEHIEWLNDQRLSGINWTYWNAYRDYALDLPPDVRTEIHNDMTKILARLHDPKRIGSWESKGLVMGSVQSGKTANYIGLMAKAMDAGYKVIIVLLNE